MSDVTDAAIQNSIGWTLVSETAEQEAEEQAKADLQTESEYAVAGDDLLDDAIEHPENDIFQMEATTREERAERPEAERAEQSQERLRSEHAPQENEQQEQPHAPTPEEVQAGVEQLDSAVKELALNEPADARAFADEFCGAFGTDVYKAGVDVGALGGVMAKTALSAFQVYEATKGDLSQMGGIPPQNAQAFAFDFLKGMGLDPRAMPVDSSLLARTVLGGAVNFIKTCESYGWKITDLSKINDPQTAEFYLQNFMKALGVEGQASRETAVRFADAFGKQMLRVWGKLSQASAQRAADQERQPRGRAQRGQRVPARFREGIKGSKVPKFFSNQDIFDPDTMNTLAMQRL